MSLKSFCNPLFFTCIFIWQLLVSAASRCASISPSIRLTGWGLHTAWRNEFKKHSWSRSQWVTSLVRSLNLQGGQQTWQGLNGGWSQISFYYCKFWVTFGFSSKGQIPPQIFNAPCKAAPNGKERERGKMEK